jgi:hypothetical protein
MHHRAKYQPIHPSSIRRTPTPNRSARPGPDCPRNYSTAGDNIAYLPIQLVSILKRKNSSFHIFTNLVSQVVNY